jgi:thymidine phosphorylase
MLEAQGARLDDYQTMLSRDSLAAATAEVSAPAAGILRDIDGGWIGAILRDHGAGRLSQGAVIRAEVGLDQIRPANSVVERGDLLARVHAGSPAEATEMASKLQRGFTVA